MGSCSKWRRGANSTIREKEIKSKLFKYLYNKKLNNIYIFTGKYWRGRRKFQNFRR